MRGRRRAAGGGGSRRADGAGAGAGQEDAAPPPAQPELPPPRCAASARARRGVRADGPRGSAAGGEVAARWRRVLRARAVAGPGTAALRCVAGAGTVPGETPAGRRARADGRCAGSRGPRVSRAPGDRRRVVPIAAHGPGRMRRRGWARGPATLRGGSRGPRALCERGPAPRSVRDVPVRALRSISAAPQPENQLRLILRSESRELVGVAPREVFVIINLLRRDNSARGDSSPSVGNGGRAGRRTVLPGQNGGCRPRGLCFEFESSPWFGQGWLRKESEQTKTLAIFMGLLSKFKIVSQIFLFFASFVCSFHF